VFTPSKQRKTTFHLCTNEEKQEKRGREWPQLIFLPHTRGTGAAGGRKGGGREGKVGEENKWQTIGFWAFIPACVYIYMFAKISYRKGGGMVRGAAGGGRGRGGGMLSAAAFIFFFISLWLVRGISFFCAWHFFHPNRTYTGAYQKNLIKKKKKIFCFFCHQSSRGVLN